MPILDDPFRKFELRELEEEESRYGELVVYLLSVNKYK